MLELIRINNYALIEECEVEFGPGFNVVTGESGAGICCGGILERVSF